MALVRQVMIADPVTVLPETSVEDVVHTLRRHELPGVPVVDGDGRLQGIITESDGKPADHASIADPASGGNPGGFLGYATAWLEYQLRGDATAAGAFTGPHPELLSNINWPGSAIK